MPGAVELSAQTIAAVDDEAKARALLEPLIAGQAWPALAHGEAEARGELAFVGTRASAAGDGRWRLSGKKSLVVGGNVADRFIVSARTRGN